MIVHKLLRVFLDVDMRCSHDGLTALAIKHKVLPESLEAGEYLLFINSDRTRIKLYGANDVVAYLRVKTGRIDMRTVALIPQAFASKGKIDYDAALRKVLEKYIPEIENKK